MMSSTERFNQVYENGNELSFRPGGRWCGRSRASFCLFGAIAAVICLVVGILIGRFAISRDSVSSDTVFKAAMLESLVGEADEDISKKILEAIEPKRIEENLKKLSEIPHTAGRQGDFDLVDLIKDRFHDSGLGVQVAPYEVLLSYPNDNIANSVRLVKGDDSSNIVYDARDDESDISHLEGVVPPFHAYAPQRFLEADKLYYVHKGRAEDYKWLRDNNINVSGSVVIARLGGIFRGDIVKIAAENGAIGVIAYTDPADYTARTFKEPYQDDRVYPETWWMPDDGAQRGTVLTGGKGDPLTPGFAANNLAYRYPEDKVSLPRIPSQPIGYGAARKIMSHMTGNDAPADWQGGMGIKYKLGPTFNDSLKIQLNVTNVNDVRRADNVFGIIEGAVEPDRYVLMGNHRDAWIYGALDPSSGTAVMLELARVIGNLVREGLWRPRRTIIFCSWAAEEYGLVGSIEWVEQYIAMLRERAVAYLNIDIAIQGNHTLRAKGTPLMYGVIYKATQKVKNPNPDEIEAGRSTVYDTWRNVYSIADGKEPPITSLGSGSDYASLLQRAGINSVDTRYSYDRSKYPIPSYALYHTEYETFDIVKDQFDRDFEFHAAVARINAEMLRSLADELVIPFDLDSYAADLSVIKGTLDSSSYGPQLSEKLDNYAKLDQVIQNFQEDMKNFKERIDNMDKTNPYEVRLVNDQILLLERAFLVPDGLPDRPLKKHILWAENSNDGYAGSSFPGLLDLLFQIDEHPKVMHDGSW